MYDKIIENFVNNLTINDIFFYSQKQDINLNNNEANFIYNYIKNNWKKIYQVYKNKGDYYPIIKDLESNLQNVNYNKAMILFNKYKNKLY